MALFFNSGYFTSSTLRFPNPGTVFVKTLKAVTGTETLASGYWFQFGTDSSARVLARSHVSSNTVNGSLWSLSVQNSSSSPTSSSADCLYTSTAGVSTVWKHFTSYLNMSTPVLAARVDGVETTSSPTVTYPDLTSSDWRMGPSTRHYFQEVAVWSIELTEGEKSCLEKGFSPRRVRPQSLIFYAPLIRNIMDWKGQQMSVSGSPTIQVHDRVY